MSSTLLRVRIGTTVTVNVPVLTAGSATSLSGRDISVFLVDPNDDKTEVAYTLSGDNSNYVTFVSEGAEQSVLGTYRAEIYENYGESSQAVVDTEVFSLVALTEYENDGDDSLSTASVTTDAVSLAYVGKDGYTPYIQDDYWYINGTSTGVKALGEDGDTPYIEDGYWYIGGTSTGVRADYSSEESARAAAEQVRVAAEAARVQSESLRVIAENARVSAESDRSSAEATRISAESDRGSAENMRVAQEEIRHDNEETRCENEIVREASEQTRRTSEATRVANEQSRINAEATRAAADATRTTDEQTRVNNEAARVQAEAARADAESDRVSAESARVSAENARVSAENARVNAEAARVTAESARASAETARQTAYTAAEAARDAAYENAEDARDATFASKEATRDAANQAATNAAASIAALQAEVDEIGPDLGQLKGGETNITSLFSFTQSKSISSTNGQSSGTVTGAWAATLNYISIDGYDNLRITMPIAPSSTNTGMAFYSAEDESSFISGVSVNYDTSLSDKSFEGRTISVPTGAKYVRLTWLHSSHSNYSSFYCYGVYSGKINDKIDKSSIVNDVVTGGADKVLSAEQGKYLAERISNIDGLENQTLTIEQGAVASATGEDTSNTTRLRTSGYIAYSTIKVEITSGKYFVLGYDADGFVAADSASWRTESATISLSGCTKYRIVFSYTDNTTITPSNFASLGVVVYGRDENAEKALTKNDIVDNLKTEDATKPLSAKQGKNIKSVLGGNDVIDLSSIDEKRGSLIISSYGRWASANSSKILMYPISGGDTIRIVTTTNTCICAFLASTSVGEPSSYVNFASNETGRREVDANSELKVVAPSNAVCLYLLKKNRSGTDILTGYTTIYHITGTVNDVDKLKTIVYGTDGSAEVVRDNPKNITILNAYKKAKQMLNIAWTPTADGMAKKSGAGTYTNGTQYTGVPYSSVKEIYNFVPRDVSFYTFVSAVNNPYSLLYTENIASSHSASAIGKTYHGANCGTYMGSVCSDLVCYALGCRIKYDTADMRVLPNLFVPIYDQSAQGVELMDVLVNSGHTILITDIYRTSRGVVTKIITIEEVGNVQQKEWTEATFNAFIAANSYTIYRYADLYKNTKYEASDVVAVTDEGEAEVTPTFNADICTFKGDKCTFKEGDTIRINFFDGSYTAMEIYKDDELVQTITELDTTNHYVDLTSLNLTYGKYKARMVNSDSTYSDYTYWEIIDCSVSFNSSTNTITWSSHNATARQAMYVVLDGTRKQVLDLEDAASGSVVMAPTFTPSATTYLTIEFFGDYGGTINEPLDTGLY